MASLGSSPKFSSSPGSSPPEISTRRGWSEAIHSEPETDHGHRVPPVEPRLTRSTQVAVSLVGGVVEQRSALELPQKWRLI